MPPFLPISREIRHPNYAPPVTQTNGIWILFVNRGLNPLRNNLPSLLASMATMSFPPVFYASITQKNLVREALKGSSITLVSKSCRFSSAAIWIATADRIASLPTSPNSRPQPSSSLSPWTPLASSPVSGSVKLYLLLCQPRGSTHQRHCRLRPHLG